MQLVYVEWFDSASINKGEWFDCESDMGILYCRSVGWTIHETERFIALAPHMNGNSFDADSNNQVCGVLCIPKVAIVRQLPIVVVVEEDAC